MYILSVFLISFIFKSKVTITESKNDTILKVPEKQESTSQWVWPWPAAATDWKTTNVDGKPVYYACSLKKIHENEPNWWIRSNEFLAGNATRIDVTVEYEVSDCNNSLYDISYCKQNLKLFIYKTSIKHDPNFVPDPLQKPDVYQKFGTTSPTNLTTGRFKRSKTNIETYSFLTNSTTPYYYFAIQSQGGCFYLYSVTISFSVCPSVIHSSDLIQLPRIIAPASGSISVSSNSCTDNTVSLIDNALWYCQANGEWMMGNARSVKCLCLAGYEKHSTGSGAVCRACPSGYYQDKPNNSSCKPCPVNSIQDVGRRQCNCNATFYRTKESDNCTGQPSAPSGINATFQNSTCVIMEWSKPVDLGGRSDEYYEVECKRCDNKGKNCTKNCTGSVITHTPNNSRNASVCDLPAYTYYQFKVSAKNGVSPLAEKSGEESKFIILIKRTAEATIAGTEENTLTDDSWSRSKTVMALAIGIPVLILLICVIIIFVLYRHRKKKNGKGEKSSLIPMSNQRLFVDPSNYNTPLEALRSHTNEIEMNNLQLKVNIGEGEFAHVYKGILITETGREEVAVKMLKPTSSTKTKKDFIREAAIMGQFKHPNVVELKGVVTLNPDMPMMIVTEFMVNGSLDHFLKSRDGMLTSLQLVGIARGVANGMAYLTEMNYIHRDLAARNILVAENLASKISDFGLSRELDNNPDSIYLTQGGKIPIRWTAPESIRYKKYSSASDVWSYGILLWEIMAFAERPYWDWENEKVFSRVEEGFRLPPPMNCPKAVHNLMLECWDKDMDKRPKFVDIVIRLDELIRSPDKMNHQEILFTSAKVNLGEVTSVEEWLIELNMRQYTDNFVNAGFTEIHHVTSLNEEGLKRLGLTLIGHRNKMKKSICKLRQQHARKPDFEIEI